MDTFYIFYIFVIHCVYKFIGNDLYLQRARFSITAHKIHVYMYAYIHIVVLRYLKLMCGTLENTSIS